VTVLDFPPYSPDLNPIENLWAIVARGVEKHTCDTVADLEAAFLAEWEKVNQDKHLLRELAHSMRRRCQAVIEAKGWHTAY